MPGAGAGGARLGSPRAPAPQLQPRSPRGLGPLLCVSFGHGGAEVTEMAGEGGGREGVLGRRRGGGSRHLCAGQGEGLNPSGVPTARPRARPTHCHLHPASEHQSIKEARRLLLYSAERELEKAAFPAKRASSSGRGAAPGQPGPTSISLSAVSPEPHSVPSQPSVSWPSPLALAHLVVRHRP